MDHGLLVQYRLSFGPGNHCGIVRGLLGVLGREWQRRGGFLSGFGCGLGAPGDRRARAEPPRGRARFGGRCPRGPGGRRPGLRPPGYPGRPGRFGGGAGRSPGCHRGQT
ncbi:MAG: hypothetical protein FJ109_15685, partial [Deltaproteobacteria bacterium]|nr:hypothetical protein [Deltaproteobacteria bacterium]